jgi:hypothetical protein
MTICDGMTPTDSRVSEDLQDVAELIEGTIALAIGIFSFPLTVMTHLGDPALSAQAQRPIQAHRAASTFAETMADWCEGSAEVRDLRASREPSPRGR